MNKQPKDGGPAFPMTSGPEPRVNAFTHCNEGMTLRDYFAGMALQGLLSADIDDEKNADCLASQAYACADAMLLERAHK